MVHAAYGVGAMTSDDARDISGWRYPGEYSFYDWDGDPGDLALLLDPAGWGSRFFACRRADELVGFFELKPDGDMLEIGLGLRPDLTGRGLGLEFVETGVAFARDAFSAENLTLGVAAFNERARTVYRRAGFVESYRYDQLSNGAAHPFVRMVRPGRLHGGGVQLRPADERDLGAALDMSLDPEVMQWYPTGVTDRQSARAWLLRCRDWTSGDHLTWTVADGADTFVGNLSIARIDRDQRCGLLAYRVAPGARGRGVASAAAEVASRFAFERLALERLELFHSVPNRASCRVADRCGFVLEGTQRLGFRDERGRRWDAHTHARLATDDRP